MQHANPSHRIVRSFVQRIHASPGQVFPLLCPEREKDWLPGWDARMIYSLSGVAERGAVFESAHAAGHTCWIVTEYDSPRRVAFARWQPDGVVVHIDISLGRHHESGTAVCIAYTYTALSEAGVTVLGAMTPEAWLKNMSFWQESMNEWFAKQEPRRAHALTISQLGKQFGLARSTLLYYDRLGVLRPGHLSAAGYRLYDAEALERLSRIVQLRSAGLPLTTIKRIVESSTPLADALERQVAALNAQLAQLRARQRVVLSLLQSPAAQRRARALSKESWTRMFRSIGLSDDDMRRWHAHFEQSMPDAHQDFLESLGIEGREIRRIREWSGVPIAAGSVRSAL